MNLPRTRTNAIRQVKPSRLWPRDLAPVVLEECTVTDEARALAERRVRYTELVVLDELGHLPFSKNAGQLLFHLLSKLYTAPEHLAYRVT